MAYLSTNDGSELINKRKSVTTEMLNEENKRTEEPVTMGEEPVETKVPASQKVRVRTRK